MQMGAVLQSGDICRGNAPADHEVLRRAMVDGRHIGTDGGDAALLYQSPDRLNPKAREVQMGGVLGSIVPQIALAVRPKAAPSGAEQHDTAGRDGSVALFEAEHT